MFTKLTLEKEIIKIKPTEPDMLPKRTKKFRCYIQ